MTSVELLISGANALGYAIAGLFFLRFWSRSRDGLFMAFAAAFGLLGIHQIVVAWHGSASESLAPFYLLRLAAFVLIIAAIVQKNLRKP
jgi:hypothetical protein